MKLNWANISKGFEQHVNETFSDKSQSAINRILIYGLCAVAVVYSLFPLVWMAITSLQPEVYLFSWPPKIVPQEWMLDHYVALFTRNDQFFAYYLNSLVVSVLSTSITIVLGTFAAYSISRFEYKGREALDNFVLLAYMFPPIVLVIPISIVISRWLNLDNTWIGLAVVYLTFALPFSIWVLREFFNGIPTSLEESAMIDGASRMQAFVYVVLPNTLPGIIATAIFTWSLAWNEYLYASVIMTSSRMQTLPVGLTQMLQTANQPWGMFMAANVVVTIPVLILFILVQDYLVKGFGAGGVKG